MEIKLNYTDNELTTLLDGLNNALISLQRNYDALMLGIEEGVPQQLLQLKIEEEEDFKHRFQSVKDLYNYLLTYEHH